MSQLTTEFYERVPKSPWANHEFRKWCVQKAWKEKDFAQELWIMCSRDILFYISVFGWLLEPRDQAGWQAERPFGNAKEIPFIPRPYQEETILQMQAQLGKKDMLVLKSREMGATWMALYLFDWSWRFERQMHYGLVSKDEISVDAKGDPDSLMVKLDFIDEHLPAFVQPGGDSRKYRDRQHANHTLVNLTNGSTITGYACTANMARGGRKRAFWKDEMHAWPAESDKAAMASTQFVCNCRIMCSTPNGQRGQSGEFHDIAVDFERDMERITLHWSRDEDKARGLYTSDGQVVKIIDETYPFPADYPFVLDGKTRSPYFDFECRRPGASDRSIAAELEMDFGGATNRFFDQTLIKRFRSQCREPDLLCRLQQQHGTWLSQLVEDPKKGDIKIWMPSDLTIEIDTNGIIHWPRGRSFAMGNDISRGTGGAFSSYSAAVVLDVKTGEQVAEWRHNKMRPEPYAQFAAVLARAFNYALMCPEATGPGEEFLSKLIEIGYTNLWFRPKSRGALYSETSLKPGYHNADGGEEILSEFQYAMNLSKCKVWSKQVINECERYFINEQGKLKHPLVGKGRVDAPENSHGDSAIAAAVAWWSIHEAAEIPVEEKEPEIPEDCFLARAQRFRDRQTDGDTIGRRWGDKLNVEELYGVEL